MLKGLIKWQTDDTSSASTPVVGGGSVASTVGGKAALASTIQLLEDDEAAIEKIENEDEKANRLLIQFPAYGTYSQSANASNLNQTADWLLGGTSHIPTSQQQKLLMKQQSQGGDEDSTTSSLPPPSNRNPNDKQASGANGSTTGGSTDNNAVHRGWDEDEQKLWRTNKAFSRPSGASGNTDKGPGPLNPKEERQKKNPLNQQDSSNDFLSAYYFHIGVTPKIAPSRGIGWAGEVTPARPTSALKESSPFSFQSPDKISNNVTVPPIPVDDGFNRPELRRPVSPPVTGRLSVASDAADVSTPSDDRQHWMPDQLCRVCYACDLPFTVFRRRHHCRICGQVFCSSCSGYFVPASQQQLQQQQQGHTMSLLSSSSSLPGSSSGASSNKTILRTCKMCYEQVTAQQQQIMVEEEAADAKRKKKEDPLSSAPAVDVVDAKKKQQQSTPLGAKQRQSEDSPSLKDQIEQEDSVLHSLSKKRTETEFAKRRLWSQQQAMEEDEKVQTTLLLQQKQEEMGSTKQPNDPSQSGKGMVLPTSPTRPGIAKRTQHSEDEKNENNNDAKLGIRHLGLTAATHLEKLGESLLSSDAPLLWREVDQQCEATGEPNHRLRKKWVSKIMSLATRCCSTVDPNVKKGDLLDIRPYCKIKGKCTAVTKRAAKFNIT